MRTLIVLSAPWDDWKVISTVSRRAMYYCFLETPNSQVEHIFSIWSQDGTILSEYAQQRIKVEGFLSPGHVFAQFLGKNDKPVSHWIQMEIHVVERIPSTMDKDFIVSKRVPPVLLQSMILYNVNLRDLHLHMGEDSVGEPPEYVDFLRERLRSCLKDHQELGTEKTKEEMKQFTLRVHEQNSFINRN